MRSICEKGFTLIELMVVISITAVLGTFGLAGFSNFNQTQVLQSSGNEVIAMLNLARSRAQSQIKPTSCTGTLSGYSVTTSKISDTEYKYQLNCVCSGGTVIMESKTLPKGISFDAVAKTIYFPVLTGGIQNYDNYIQLFGSGDQNKIITVDSLGRIVTQLVIPTPLPTAAPTPTFFPTPTPYPTSTPIPLPTSTPIPATPTPTPTISGQIAWWKMNGNASDSSGNGNNGAATGAISNGSYYSFSGANGINISVSDNSLWILPGDFSIGLWFNLSTLNQGNWWTSAFIAQDEGGGNVSKWIFAWDKVADKLAFHVNTPSGSPNFVISSNVFSAAINTWYNIILTRSGNLYTFYKNGVAIGSVTQSGVIPNATFPLTIGWGEGSGSFNGLIDDVQIYNRALSQIEIGNIVAAGRQ